LGVKFKIMKWAGNIARTLTRKGDNSGEIMERKQLEELGADEKVLLKVTFQKLVCGIVDWIDLAQDRVRLRALVNAVIKLRIR
jgi:cobalamin biosynthesis protein CbiD